MKTGLISDTHSYLDPLIAENLTLVDEIWHAGDIGNMTTFETLEKINPVRAVYGNIDGHELRAFLPSFQLFEIEGLKIFMTHIGGYPGKYAKNVRLILEKNKVDIFISGHSHILKIMPDKELNLLHINPGSAGNYGFHKVKTMVVFELNSGKIENLKVIECGKRNVI